MNRIIPNVILSVGLLTLLVTPSVHAQSIDKHDTPFMAALESSDTNAAFEAPALDTESNLKLIEHNSIDSCCDSCVDSCISSCVDGAEERQYLTGDLWGLRSSMAGSGVLMDLQLTQFYQGVSGGGTRQTFKYGGKADYRFTFVGEKLGLNKGFTAIMHAETRFSQDINGTAGVLAFPNINMLYPTPGENITAITGLMITQALSEKVALTIGKYNGSDLFGMMYPNLGGGIEGFMNAAFLMPATLMRTTNLSFNGAGVLGLKGPQIQSALLAYDTQNSSTTIAPDLFDAGAVVLGYHRFFTEFAGLPGSQGFLANYSTGTYRSTDPLSYTVIPGQGLNEPETTGSWTLTHFGDQILWADQCNEKRNVRLFTMLSLGDTNPNPYRWTSSMSVEATGAMDRRPADRMGVGYFYNGLNDNFKDLVNKVPVINIRDVQGVELYYNAEINPWFHVTADFQVIQNQNIDDNTVIVPGIRANIKF